MGRIAVAALIILACSRVAEAGRIVVAETYAESDLADEAGAFTMLLRAALDTPGRPVVASHELKGIVIDLDRADAVMQKLDGDALVACDLERDGTNLRVSVIAVGRDGQVAAAAAVSAGDGDLPRLVAETVRVAAPVIGADAAVPQVSLGQLRPFVRASAALARGDVGLAATFLESAEAIIPLKVKSIGATLRPGWAGAAVDQPTAVAIALAAGTPQDVLDVAQAGTPRDHAARALAAIAIADTDGAAKALAKAGKDPLATLAAARLARRKGEAGKLAAAVGKLLERPAPYVPALALVAELPAGAVPAALEDTALRQAAADPRLARLASVLGLRAAQRGPGPELNAALAAIRVVDLDESELDRLEPIVARAAADGSRPALRLAAELAAREGDRAHVDAAVKRWLGVAADDPAAQLYRGRLAVAAMRLDEAKIAFAAAKANRELARVAIAAGDWATAEQLLAELPEDSAERHVVAARVALAKNDVTVARKELDLARALTPASGRMLDALADTMEQANDGAAANVRELALKLAPIRGDAVATRPGSGTGTGTGTGMGRADVKGLVLDTALADALDPLVAALPLPAGGGVAVVQLPSPAPGFFALRVAHPGPLRPPLVAALGKHGHRVAADAGPAVLARNKVTMPLARDRLEALADDLGASHVVLYQVSASGGDARVRLVAFDRGTGRAFEVTGTVPGSRGLVGWNTTKLPLLGSIVLALLLVAGYFVLRGRSGIVVEITLDPDGSDEAICVDVSASSQRPAISDPSRWRKDTRKAGHEVKGKSARLVGPRTFFRVPPGTWYVHVYGVYIRDHADRAVPPVHTRKIEVARGKTAVAAIDLGMPVAEVQLAIHDTRRGGIAVWLDSDLADKVYTDADGRATLYATVGQHTLVIDAHDMRVEKPLPIAAAQIKKLNINLVRERRLAEVSDGLTLGPAEHAPALEPNVQELAAAPPPVVPAAPPPALPTAATQAMPAGAATMRDDEPDVGSRVLGRYRVEAELGRGAMGVVFKAWDENLERTVAVKILARSVREIPQAMTLFLSEAKALAQLNHPNIVSVHDQATDERDTYIIMEFVDGTTVDRLLQERGGKLPLRTALGVIDQLCSGLAYAHGKKVVHRDIKPANIFVSRDKVVKLGDFGIARVLREIEIRQTDVRGTPLYMAPEQINGTNINHRADLYAVGCTLFELVAGRPPFLDGNVMAHHLFTEPQPLSAFEPSVPPALDELVAACLVKDSAERIATASDIQARIRAIGAALPR